MALIRGQKGTQSADLDLIESGELRLDAFLALMGCTTSFVLNRGSHDIEGSEWDPQIYRRWTDSCQCYHWC